MTEQEQREAVIREATSFIGTPYREAGRLKGVGVDCLTFIVQTYENVGLIPRIDIPHYSPQWHFHRNQELYLQGINKYAHEVETPGPGDIVLWKFARCFSHGGIITNWPEIIHSVKGIGVHPENALQSSLLTIDNGQPRAMKFFSFWGE